MITRILSRLSFLLFLIAFLSCQKQINHRDIINLSGQWQFALDSSNIGIQQQWFLTEFQDTMELPGTTDLRQKGFLNHDTTTLHLNRIYKYEGPAWYRKKVHIPAQFQDKHIQLIMERTKSSKVWIDDTFVGESSLLQSPQHYDLSTYLSPGEHTITIRINNDLKLTPYGNVHIYTDETQTNWNGIIGDLKIEASTKTYISALRVFPDISNKKVNIELAVVNDLQLENVNIDIEVTRFTKGSKEKLKTFQQNVACDSLIVLEYDLADEMALWDDYQQPLYQLTAVLNHEDIFDSKTANFGMREFKAEGKQFTINGRKTFLRGKNDACIFPLTGHPPMDAEGWIRVFKIAQSYGINHYRFHSWCPPKAAFEAADLLGIFLQPELPFWGGLESDSIAAMLLDEGRALLKSYANHPSFVMFAAGNEIWSGHDRVETIISTLKETDNRPLYTMGSNNNIGYIAPPAYADFHLAARTPSDGDTMLTHTRLTHSFADSRDGATLNTKMPSTLVNFEYPVAQIDMPLISHEIGQYQIYPDYEEIKKYTGVVRAWNFEVFRKRLEKAGLYDQNIAFQKASGAWAALCYKAEMEAALRTKHFAGFQLLDLQDFPGQGTALVGILDAFMDSKNVISRENWLQSCNDVVLLLEFPKYCWQTNETFQASVKIANYSNRNLTDELNWELLTQEGNIVESGTLNNLELVAGELHNIGKININLASIEKASQLTLNVALKESAYTNSYPVWIYPQSKDEDISTEILITDLLDDSIISKLKAGQKVLLFPTAESVKEKSVAGLFPPDFWNYGMFKGISERANKPVSPGTLGILTNPKHPIFKNFPTDNHTNWQWWSIIKASRPLILNKTTNEYRPIVQVIDNMERNNKVGLIFEFKMGDGKLMVCMSRLKEISDNPEARQLYKSIISYMKSDLFAPNYNANEKLLKSIL